MSTPSKHHAKPSHPATSAPESDPAAVKDPADWTTGDEPATGPQLSYLKTLSHDAGKDFDENEALTKSEASKRIDALRAKSPRVHEGS